jgi:hypothetical protein
MKILYNSILNIVKKQSGNQTGEMIFAYCFATFAGALLLWHIIDKIITFSVVSAELKLIFT